MEAWFRTDKCIFWKHKASYKLKHIWHISQFETIFNALTSLWDGKERLIFVIVPEFPAQTETPILQRHVFEIVHHKGAQALRIARPSELRRRWWRWFTVVVVVIVGCQVFVKHEHFVLVHPGQGPCCLQSPVGHALHGGPHHRCDASPGRSHFEGLVDLTSLVLWGRITLKLSTGREWVRVVSPATSGHHFLRERLAIEGSLWRTARVWEEEEICALKGLLLGLVELFGGSKTFLQGDNVNIVEGNGDDAVGLLFIAE